MKIDALMVPVRTVDLVIGTRTVVASALRGAEQNALADAFPRPVPPMRARPGDHPEKGELVLREDDEVYQQRMSTYRSRLTCMEIAASIGLESGDGATFASARGEIGRLRKWGEAVYADLVAAFDWNQLAAIAGRIASISDPVRLAEEALKN